MTTKKFMKEMMGLGIPRNTARAVVRRAREEKVPNVVAYYVFCEELAQVILRGLGCSAGEPDGGTGGEA